MIVHLGLHLDGLQPSLPRTAVGEVVLGPLRMLDLLELRLGLPPAIASPAEALLEYEACLADVDDDARFYSRSFATDTLGVARTLLGWRARWHEAGWPGTFDGPVSRRLAEIAAVETVARDRVPLTPGQRVQRVAAALEQGLQARIDRIVLHDTRAEWPAAWRRVLERFDVDVAPGTAPAATGETGTDLHRVQQALLALEAGDEGTRREPEALAGDDSLIVVRAISRDLSAQAIGEYLLKTGALDDTVVIAERDGIIVDNAFERVGLPRAGFQHYSRFRAVSQVLKLCLGLIWEPIDPHLLLQFLIHPVAPLPGHARSALADAVASEPGVGGTAWRHALDRISERMRTKLERSDDEVAALIDDVRYWLEGERHDPAGGAPLPVLIERARRCTNWLARRLHMLDDEADVSLYAAAEAQADALVAGLGVLLERGETVLPRIALERLVDEVGGRSADPGTFAEAGHVLATTEPAAVTEARQTVIWWDLADHAPRLGYPWSEAELAELAAEGVALPSVDALIDRRLQGWLRPVLNARRQLILVVHDRDEGRHPLWSRLQSLFENFNEIRIEDTLLGVASRATIPALEIPTEPLALAPLPRPRRWWTLPDERSVPPRATESYSSLKKLIDYPHEWVLNYAAKLRPGRAADLPSGNLLNGNLAHRLLESFFGMHADWASLDDRAVATWLAGYLPRLIEQEGALLCEPGAGVERERVIVTLERALARLLAHLRGAGIVSVAAEQTTEAPYGALTLRGAIDLLLRDRDGNEIVLDVKWGGEPYRGTELAENRYLQLATYAYMRRHAPGATRWPGHAYFIVSTGNVLAHDTRAFPDAVTFPPATAESAEAVWARIAASDGWRRAQLRAGRIEVNAAGTEPTGESVPPANALEAADGPDGFDDYARLTGWDEGA